MRKNLILSSLLLLSLIFFSCEKSTKNTVLPKYDNKINLGKLEVGQTSVYQNLETDFWPSDSAVFFRTTDTMQLKVVAEDENGFKIEMRYSSNPPSVTNNFYFAVQGDSLFVKPLLKTEQIPYIFSNYSSDSKVALLLNGAGLPVWNLNKWLIPRAIPFGVSYGYPENLKLNGASYFKVLGHRDDGATAFDAPTIVKLYSKESGFISFQILGNRPRSAIIWNLIP
jgi:hypothetical protein